MHGAGSTSWLRCSTAPQPIPRWSTAYNEPRPDCRDGVLEEARRAAEVLVDDAAANHNGSLTVHATDDVVIGVHPDEDTARRHREVLELQRGVEELSFVITPLVEEQPPAGVDPMPVSSPPDSWTAADAFAEVFR